MAHLPVGISGFKGSFHEKPAQFVFGLLYFSFYVLFSFPQPSPYHRLPEPFTASMGESHHHVMSSLQVIVTIPRL